MQNQRDNQTPATRNSDSESESVLHAWFLDPPYPGVWIAGVFVAVVAALIATTLSSRRPEPAVQVAAQPPVSAPPAPQPTVTVKDDPGPAPVEIPQVRVRSAPAPPANGPDGTGGNAPLSGVANSPGNAHSPIAEGEPLPELRNEDLPPPDATPRGVEPPGVTRSPELEVPEVTPEPPRPPARPRVPEPAVPERANGRLAIYFDADSTTFDRRGRRLPLRVEVFVDGRKVVESDDPEKQEFIVGRLKDGWHQVEIVPYVADAPSEPRRQRVFIESGAENRFKAVIRREDGASRVSKFKERD